jgi:hypothetical protein
MPWEPLEVVTQITVRAAIEALTAMLKAVPDPAERKRLATVIANEADRVEQDAEASGDRPAVPAGKQPVRHCGQCGRPYRPKRAGRSVYCSPACRVAAFEARKAANGTALA